MILFPAIDLKDGLCVRLEQGDMARATVFSRDPAAQAHAFEMQGFRYLHLVDLDGAFAGKPVNAAAVDRILETIAIPVQLGGGIRDTATVEAWLEKGVTRVIIGTAAVRDPPFVRQAAHDFPRRIAVGLDARDGMLQGINWDATIALAEAISIPVIASGGFASIEDVKALVAPRARKLQGAVVGRALYDGRVDPAEALALVRDARAKFLSGLNHLDGNDRSRSR